MTSTTGSEIAPMLQAHVDRLWVTCVNCSIADRQEMWDRSLMAPGPLATPRSTSLEDAIQDAGFRLGLLKFDARTARFSGSKMG